MGTSVSATRRSQAALVWVTALLPLGWWLYLTVSPHAGFRIERYQELVSWANVAAVPLLGFLALAAHLATGSRSSAALAWAALAFAAVFPLHRLFTAEKNASTSFLFYGTLARFAFAGCFLVFFGRGPPEPPAARRRNLLIILALTGVLAVVRFAFKGPLDYLAEALGESANRGPVETVRKFIEAGSIVLAGAAALRCFAASRRPAGLAAPAVPLALVLTAEESAFFLVSDPPDLWWWSANLLWGLATLLMIGGLLATAAEAGREAPPAGGRRPAVGSEVGGYEVLRPLGEGGMGQVFQARDPRLDRLVALKIIRPDQGTDSVVVRRFRREAVASARLAHRNIAQVYDAAEADGLHFLVMEYVEGQDLAGLLREHGPLPVPLACECVRQACLGLQHAHERGLVHRDIKPANLVLTADGRTVKLLDMGVARVETPLEHEPALGQLTQTGAVMGTPAYLAPEQARDPRRVDIRADVYSLGCTFYHMLAGRVPFEGTTLAEVVLRHQLEEPAALTGARPEVPTGVRRIVARMMAKRPEDRYQTPAEVSAALAPFADVTGEAVALWRATRVSARAARAEPVPPEPRGSRLGDTWSEAEPSTFWYMVALAAGVGVMAVAAGVLVWSLWP
jgi:serine/threonine protein kinase